MLLCHQPDTLREFWRRSEVGDLLANRTTQLERSLMNARADMADVEVTIDLGAPHQVEFAIQMTVDQGPDFFAAHFIPPFVLVARGKAANARVPGPVATSPYPPARSQSR